MGRWVDRAVFCAGLRKIVKSALFALLPVFALAGCVQKSSLLDDAQERCMKQGGMLMIIYTQELTLSGAGEQIPSPGRCVMPENFDKPSAPEQPPPQPAQQPPPQGN
jgi:hypothetical protein